MNKCCYLYSGKLLVQRMDTCNIWTILKHYACERSQKQKIMQFLQILKGDFETYSASIVKEMGSYLDCKCL